MLDKAISKEDFENFQRTLLLVGGSIYGVYPPDDETQKAYQKRNEKGTRN